MERWVVPHDQWVKKSLIPFVSCVPIFQYSYEIGKQGGKDFKIIVLLIMVHFITKQGKESWEKGKAQIWVEIIRCLRISPHPPFPLSFFCQSPCHWLKTSSSFDAFPSPGSHRTNSPDFSHISTFYLFDDFIQALVTSSLDESFIHFIHSTNIG